MSYLLDTHILLWWCGNTGRLSRKQKSILDGANADAPLLVSEISLWEIATLVNLNRIALDLPLSEWLESATALPLVERVGISPTVAATVASLPATFPRDPADRIIVATAKVNGATLLTQDMKIRKARVVKTLA